MQRMRYSSASQKGFGFGSAPSCYLEQLLGLGDFVPQLSGRAAEGTPGQNWNFLETQRNEKLSWKNGDRMEERRQKCEENS